jgi:hypothetical protein
MHDIAFTRHVKLLLLLLLLQRLLLMMITFTRLHGARGTAGGLVLQCNSSNAYPSRGLAPQPAAPHLAQICGGCSSGG